MKLDKNDLKEIKKQINDIKYEGFIEEINNENLKDKYTGSLSTQSKHIRADLMNKDEYTKFIEINENTYVNNYLCELIVAYDISSYEYWHEEGKDHDYNYYYVLILLKKEFYTIEEIKILTNMINNFIEKINYQYYINNVKLLELDY